MAFYSGLAPLRDVLAGLYPAESIARAVVGEADVSAQLIDFDGSAVEFWTSILDVAQSNHRVQDVIDVARKHFPKNKELIEAEQIFHSTPPPALVGNTDEPEGDGSSKRSGDTTLQSVDGSNSGIMAGGDVNDANIVNTGDITGEGNAVIAGSGNTVQQAHGRIVAQAGSGGSTTVHDESRNTMFDQRGQQVDTQYNIAGDYNPADVQDRANAVAELRKLLAEIDRTETAGLLDADVATDATYQIKKALNQAEKPEPDRNSILDHLTAATEMITAVSGTVGLATALIQAMQMVQRLF